MAFLFRVFPYKRKERGFTPVPSACMKGGADLENGPYTLLMTAILEEQIGFTSMLIVRLT